MASGSVGKRKAERRECRVRAQILIANKRDPVDCLMLNSSGTGARLKLNAEMELPPRFKLFIPSRPETKTVIVRWRNGLEVGCEYGKGLANSEDEFYELIDRIERLEAAMSAGVTLQPGPAPAAEPDSSLAARVADIEARIASWRAQPAATPEEEIETVVAAPVAAEPDAALLARIAQIEATVAKVSPGPEASLVQKIADLEAKLMAPRAAVAPPAVDIAPLERRLEQAETGIEDRASRLERYLGGRIDDLEAQMISAPPPSATRNDVAAEHAIDNLGERLSNLEVSLMELRSEPVNAADASMIERIERLEARNGEVIAALRNVMALLTAPQQQRAAG